MEKKKMTYGALLQSTVGKLGRDEKSSQPLKPTTPASLGARIAQLEEIAKKPNS